MKIFLPMAMAAGKRSVVSIDQSVNHAIGGSVKKFFLPKVFTEKASVQCTNNLSSSLAPF
jgi:hypothetical protein